MSDNSDDSLSSRSTYEDIIPEEHKDDLISQARALNDLISNRYLDLSIQTLERGNEEQRKKAHLMEVRRMHENLLEYVLDNMDSIPKKQVNQYRRILRRYEVELGMIRKKQPAIKSSTKR